MSVNDRPGRPGWPQVDATRGNRFDAVRLAGDEVDRAGRRWTVLVAVRVVAHREMLRVIPERRHRVAVVVAHDEPRRRERPGAAGACASGVLGKEIDRAVVIGALLRRVRVRLVGGRRLRAIEAEWIRRAGAILGISAFGLFVSSSPRRPFGSGVFGTAVKAGSPGGFVATG